MDEKLLEENGQRLPAQKEEEEEMEVTMTTQVENLSVTPDKADMSSNTEIHPGETLPLDSVCKTEDSDDGDSEDSDRYLYTHTHTHTRGVSKCTVWKVPCFWGHVFQEK